LRSSTIAAADRVGRKRQRERHPVCFAERLAVAQDAVVARRRLDSEADGLEPANELAHVLPHSFSWQFGGRTKQCLSRQDDRGIAHRA
jgi:hypothetical protein